MRFNVAKPIFKFIETHVKFKTVSKPMFGVFVIFYYNTPKRYFYIVPFTSHFADAMSIIAKIMP